MWWRPLDTALDRIRNRIGEDPSGAREEIQELLRTAGPTARVRLWGLEITACLSLGDLEGAARAYDRGRELRGSVLGRAELEGQGATLLLTRGDSAAALRAADRALALIRPLAMAPPAKGSKKMMRYVRATYGAVLVARAQAGTLPGAPQPATVAAVLEALTWIDPRYVPRVHLAAVSTLATLLTTRAAGPADLEMALRLERDAQRLLNRRRVRACHPHRAQLRVIRALVLAKLGAVERAEQLMERRVIPDLRAAGLDAVAKIAAEQLVWIVAERAGQLGRAAYLRRRHGLAPADPPPPPPEDDGSPIGF